MAAKARGQRSPEVSQDPYRGQRAWAIFSAIGILLVLTTVIGFGLGRWADQRFGTEPWLSMVGLLIGAASGLVETVRLINRYGGLS
jgi:ATP synthase protein I